MSGRTDRLKLVVSDKSDGPGDELPDPIAQIEQEHALQTELCDLLEGIADGLPDEADRTHSRVAVSVLRNGMPQHMKMEDELLFPLLRKRATRQPSLLPMLEQLSCEHDTDVSYGYEIADELDAHAETGRVRNPNMLGYMLRGFFEGQRRHIEWESQVVLPLARQVLLEEDLEILRGRMTSHLARGGGRASLEEIREAVTADARQGNREDSERKR